MAVFGRRYVAVLAAAVAMAVVAALAGFYFAAQPRAQTASPSCTTGTLVQTNSGPVCGMTANGQTYYLGIPYAAPPVGQLRWRPPQPVHPWTTTFQAAQRGAACPTPGYPPGSPPQAGTSEDCLNLEVEKPADVRPGQRLPVMFEIHGGGFLGEALTDNGANFVRTGPVVYVYIRYRLGILGFLADNAFGPHSGDYGLQDQQAALRWVKRNIARFGGNPQNVTIFGESAGGASVCDQVASPTAKGLFQQGISVSGFYNFNVNTIWWPADCKSKLKTEAQAQQMGAAFAAKVGCGKAADVAACLRAVPVNTLLEKGGQIVEPFAGGAIGPIVNGTTLPMSAAKAFELGRVNKVKLMIGVGRDEFNGGIYTNSPGHTVVANTPAQYRQLVRQQFGSLAAKVMRLYPLRRFPTPAPFIAYRTIMADAFSVCPALVSDARVAKYIPVYAYQDDDADSPNPVGQSLGAGLTAAPETQPLGAFHSGVNHLAHDPPASLDANQAALQSQVLAEWTGFARTGNPTVAYTPVWKRYTASGRPVMSLVPAGDSALTPTSAINKQHNCGFWDAVNRTAPWAP
ncbi:MAG: carboxylesterase family protein [Solirubrobacterales bacterium]|nr:carboxylesterase family protein [Solirubrobacterales bacterium]